MARTLNKLLKIFPTPKILAMPSVAIEITPEAVRFIELIANGSSLSVGKYGERAITLSGSEDDFPQDPSVSEALSEIKQKYKLSLVTISLPEEKAYIFSTEVPALSPREIRAGLELKLEEYVPIPPREAVFDYQVIGNNPENGHVRVSVAVVPHLVVSRYVELLASVGLVPISFDISAQAAADALIKKGDDSPSILVNVGRSSTRLSLVSRRAVHFSSLVNAGGSAMPEAIKKSFKNSDADAEKKKWERGISRKKEDAEIFFALANTLSVLKDEIEKLVGYWDAHFDRYSDTKQKIEKVVVYGSEAGIPGLPEYLEASLSVRVEVGDVWKNVFSFDSYIPPLSRKESLAYASVVGLSLRNKI